MKKLLAIAIVSTFAVAAHAKHHKVNCHDAKNADKAECKAAATAPATAGTEQATKPATANAEAPAAAPEAKKH
jgi:hypothetical protein